MERDTVTDRNATRHDGDLARRVVQVAAIDRGRGSHARFRRLAA
jgi:hypothetical protein